MSGHYDCQSAEIGASGSTLYQRHGHNMLTVIPMRCILYMSLACGILGITSRDNKVSLYNDKDMERQVPSGHV